MWLQRACRSAVASSGAPAALLLTLSLLQLLPTLGQQVSAADVRDDPDYRTKVGGGCDDDIGDSILSAVSEVISDTCDPTKTCCRDWLDEAGEPGAGSTKACAVHTTSGACEESLGCNWVAPPSSFFGDSLPGSCKPDLTQTCCGCDNVSPDGKCGTWTSVCFKCTGTIAEDFCPEACAFDILKWRTGIDAVDEPLLEIPPGCADPGLDAAAHLGCQEVPRFQVAIAAAIIYLVLGCSVAPPLFWPCKCFKCCCKCLPGADSLCEEAYSSPDSASSDDEDVRRERRERRRKQEIRLKKKKANKKTSSGGRENRRERELIEGGSDDTRFRVLERAMLKDGCELDSEIVGSLTEGTVIRCLERKTNLEGQDRVRCNKGWVSVVAKDGSVLLEQVGGQGNAAAAGAAVDQMRAAAGGGAARGAGPSAQAPAQSSEWDERHSAEHNRKYWVNRTTGKSTWHDPNREAQTTRARQPTGGARQSQATRARQPTGGARPAQQSAWVERYSDQHQRKFWTNRSTGESTWNDPTTTTQNPAHAGELEV